MKNFRGRTDTIWHPEKTVSFKPSSDNLICQNALLASGTSNIFTPGILEMISSKVGK